LINKYNSVTVTFLVVTLHKYKSFQPACFRKSNWKLLQEYLGQEQTCQPLYQGYIIQRWLYNILARVERMKNCHKSISISYVIIEFSTQFWSIYDNTGIFLNIY